MTVEPVRRALVVIAAVGLGIGACALVVALGGGFTDPVGALLFSDNDDLLFGALVRFNPLGALVTVAVSSVALAGALARARAVVLAAAVGFGACAAQVLAQFGRSENVLGGQGGTLSLFVGLAVGLAVPVLTPAGEEGSG